MPAMLGSLRVRLTTWYVVVLAVTLLGYATVLVLSLQRGLENSLDRVLGDAAHHATLVLQTESDPAVIASEFRRINAGTVVGIYDASDGRLVAGRGLAFSVDPVQLARPDGIVIRTEPLQDGSMWRTWIQFTPQIDAPDRVLVVARGARFIPIAITELMLIVGLSAPFALLVAVVGGIFLAGRALKPIDTMARTADAITAEDLSRRLTVSTHDEIGRLAATFNRMLDRLASAFDRQRRFTADASHELRTPLAILVTRAGMALDRDRSVAQYRETLNAVRDEGLHMGRIINDLLLLARADEGVLISDPERLDCADLLRSVGDAMRPVADNRGVQLQVHVDDPLVVLGDQTRLTQLLVNLVDNAISHTPPGGRVELEGRLRAGSVVLEVNDSGCGIAADDLPHVFDRFYRAATDRSTERGGAGLGLSLCQVIAVAHRGAIELHSELGHGTQAIVRLPAAPEDHDGSASTPASVVTSRGRDEPAYAPDAMTLA